jgi:hypothetical protein
MVYVQGYSTVTYLHGIYFAPRTEIPEQQLVRNAVPRRFPGKFARVAELARVRNLDYHVAPNGYELYTCMILFHSCTRLLAYIT